MVAGSHLAEWEFAALSERTLPFAEEFAEEMQDSRTFTFFRHTRPSDLLRAWHNWSAWLVFARGACVGWAHSQLLDGHKSHVARLGFAVLPQWQSNGLGSALMDRAIEETRRPKLVATAFEDNDRMVQMFLKRSFVVEGRFVDEERWDDLPRTVLSLARFR